MRECLCIVDPAGAAHRFQETVNRRKYFVPHINCLWHIDGHHKLFAYRIVIFGIIDGKSRMLVGVMAMNNNWAGSRLCVFQVAVAKYGIPSRVRADYGTEMLRLKEAMGELQGVFSQADQCLL